MSQDVQIKWRFTTNILDSKDNYLCKNVKTAPKYLNFMLLKMTDFKYLKQTMTKVLKTESSLGLNSYWKSSIMRLGDHTRNCVQIAIAVVMNML